MAAPIAIDPPKDTWTNWSHITIPSSPKAIKTEDRSHIEKPVTSQKVSPYEDLLSYLSNKEPITRELPDLIPNNLPDFVSVWGTPTSTTFFEEGKLVFHYTVKLNVDPAKLLASVKGVKSVLSKIDTKLNLRNSKEVKTFIQKDHNPEGFVGWINNTVRKVKTFFPQEQLYLQLFSNPEGSNWDFLILSIATEKEVGEALKLLRDFQESDWINENAEFTGKLTVDLEFQ